MSFRRVCALALGSILLTAGCAAESGAETDANVRADREKEALVGSSVVSRPYVLQNLSNETITLAEVTGQNFSGVPAGTQLKTGETASFTLLSTGTKESDRGFVTVVVSTASTPVYTTAYVMLADVGDGEPQMSVSGDGDRFVGTPDVFGVLGAPSSVISIEGSDEQSRIASALCWDGGPAERCTFEGMSKSEVIGEPEPVGDAVINNTDVDNKTTVTWNHAVTNTNSLNISATLGYSFKTLVSQFDVSFTAAYGHTWTSAYTFGQSVDVTVPAHQTAYLLHKAPLFRLTGDLTVKVQDTTLILRGVHLDTPNAHGEGALVIENRPNAP